jgi:hypothetical protein
VLYYLKLYFTTFNDFFMRFSDFSRDFDLVLPILGLFYRFYYLKLYFTIFNDFFTRFLDFLRDFDLNVCIVVLF